MQRVTGRCKKMQPPNARCIYFATTRWSLHNLCNELLLVAFFCNDLMAVAFFFATSCWSLQKNATASWSLHKFLQRPFTRCKILCNDRVLVALFLQRPYARCKLNATTDQSLHSRYLGILVSWKISSCESDNLGICGYCYLGLGISF